MIPKNIVNWIHNHRAILSRAMTDHKSLYQNQYKKPNFLTKYCEKVSSTAETAGGRISPLCPNHHKDITMQLMVVSISAPRGLRGRAYFLTKYKLELINTKEFAGIIYLGISNLCPKLMFNSTITTNFDEFSGLSIQSLL